MKIKNFKSFGLFIFIFSIVIYFYLINTQLIQLNDEFFLWSSLNYFLFFTPIIYYYSKYSLKISSFPFIGLLGITLLFSYGIPPFLIDSNSYQIHSLTIDSLQISFWSYFIFFLTFYFFQYFFIQIKPYKPIYIIDIKKLKLFSLLNVSIYLLSITILNSLNHFGDYALFIYLGLNLIFNVRNFWLNYFEKVLFYSVFIYEIITRITSGLASPLIMFFLYVFIIDYLEFRSIKRLIIPSFIIIVLYFLFSFIKVDYRKSVWEGGIEVTTSDKIQILKDLTFEDSNIENLKDNEEKSDKDNFFWRFSYQASALSLVVDLSPSIVPFWNGETYKVFSKFIPRIIWADKPSENLGQEFGHRYGVLSLNDTNTSMNTPILAEAYMNYGKFGAYLVMALLAILYAFLDLKFNRVDNLSVNLIFGISLLFPLIIHESNFSLIFGNMPLKLIALNFLFRIFKINGD